MPVRNLQYYAITAPDRAIAARFYTDFGLEIVRDDDKETVFRCFGREQDQLIVYPGPVRRTHHVCFGCGAGELDAIADIIRQEGISSVDAPDGTDPGGIWFRDFDDMLTRVIEAEDAPISVGMNPVANRPGSRQRRAQRTEFASDPTVRPRRLGHVVLFTTDPDRKAALYNRLFGLKVSDTITGILQFLYCPTGSDHHIVAVARSAGYGIQHAGYEVGDADEAAIGLRQMRDRGYVVCWGPGRHGPGSNIYAYLRDPWNGMVEYFADIDFIPENSDWEPGVWESDEATVVWGGTQPPDFPTNFEIMFHPSQARRK